jgi:hypothetical protein
MKIAVASIEIVTPYCQSRYHETPKLNKELSGDYERRTWRERLHVEDDGQIVVPGMAFANCIKEAAKFLSIQVPGKGKTTWTKHFEAGISVIDDVLTGKLKEEAIERQMFVPSDGKRGGGTRVMKSYPILMPPLKLQPVFYIQDDSITPEVFAIHLQQAGTLIGIGSFRVRNNGVCGQFRVDEIDWRESEKESKLPTIKINGVIAA